ncbi:MAG: hypothetical protein WCD07_07590 [Burkholderiales bacterium]
MIFSMKSARQCGLSLLILASLYAYATPDWSPAAKPASGATAGEAGKFVADAERRRAEYGLRANREPVVRVARKVSGEYAA